MISDEEIDSLPDDPDAAFVQFEAILREDVRRRNSDDYRGWDVEREYVAHVLAFVNTRDVLIDLPSKPPREDGDFGSWYREFVRAVDYFKAVARLQISARKKVNVSVLALSPDFKTRIGGHLTAIRKIVSDADVSENKRDVIFKRISNLQEEVDRDRTRTEAVLALWLDVTSAAGKGVKNLEPVFDRMQKIIKVLSDAKDESEQKALMAPQERKRLSPPTISDDPPVRRDELDDEIPF